MENAVLLKITEHLPPGIKQTMLNLKRNTFNTISEIRLRADKPSTVTVCGENLYICYTGISKNISECLKITQAELDNFIFSICSGSVYSYENTIKNGYISRFGARIGICGNVIIKNSDITGFSKINSVNIRIPCHVPGCSKKLLDTLHFNAFSSGKGILVASAPGVGKTTLLRDIAIILSTASANSAPYRVLIIDERNEINIQEIFKNSCADIYSGIDKKSGFEYAIRCMSPQVIICDEIGSEKEADLILSAYTGGISVIASVHASCLNDIYTKPSVKKLCDVGVFSHIYIMNRINGIVSGKLYESCGKEVMIC